MITEDQEEVITFLASPATHEGAAVERLETHASIVFLAGPRAWKLKRAVRYDYLDFSTSDRRKAMCEAEVRINRRTAPALYRGVVAVTRRPDGSLALGGSDTPVDWLVEMVRFDQDDLFDRLAARGGLDLDLMGPLASAIARFHAGAERRPDHGGVGGMAWVIEGNAAGFADLGRDVFDLELCDELTREARRLLERDRTLIDRRRVGGFVRQCHGDLHLRNLVRLEGHPTLFDAIEFNDEIACIDVFYDLAFLLMDLWRRHLPRHANQVWNGYLFETGDTDGIPLLPLFLSCRAAVRAKTSATAASLQHDPRRQREFLDAAREYLEMARRLLAPAPPCLIAVGGFSGAGKSALAQRLGPSLGAAPGAVVVRSDEVRKQLCGVDRLHRLGADGYTADVTRRVYSTVADRAAMAVGAGHAAIVDAVYARPGERDAIEGIAAAAGVPFVGLWLEAPEPVLIARAGQRRSDASDADAAVIRRQAAMDTGAITWHRVDAAPDSEKVLASATDVIRDSIAARSLASGM